MKPAVPLSQLLLGRNLTEAASVGLFNDLFADKMTPEDAKSLLLLLAKKGETPLEIMGCHAALRRYENSRRVNASPVIDTCGTGGDGSHSINVSTLTAFWVAAAGGHVAKHGNRAISSKCGSSDLMEALGIKIDCAPEKMFKAVAEIGIGYFHAPFYHPTFLKFQSLRRRLRIRTIFNLLGPLVNPVRLDGQLVGVSRPDQVALYSECLRRLQLKRALVCHSLDGMDEISAIAPTRIAMITGSQVRHGVLEPQRLGFLRGKRHRYSKLRNRKEIVALSLSLLKGQGPSLLSDLILINAAAALWVAAKVRNLTEGVALARRILLSGKPYQILLQLKAMTHEK